jgi:hypothetical protein
VLSSGTYIRLKDHIALKINDFTGVTMAPIYKDASKLAPLLDPDLADRLMRAEEYSGNAKDQHGRFVSSSSKYSNIRVPEVSIALKRNMGELDYPNCVNSRHRSDQTIDTQIIHLSGTICGQRRNWGDDALDSLEEERDRIIPLPLLQRDHRIGS